LAAETEDIMSKFFTYEERLDLQKYLKDSLSFKEIARRMDKDPTTISREVRNYCSEVATGYPGFSFNACVHRMNCRNKEICGSMCTRKSAQYCKLCSKCNSNCPDFLEELCMVRFKPPYVCNSCESIGKWTLMKNIYHKVKFRERYKKPEFKVDKGCRIDRNYKDFGAFLEKHPDTAIVQMDSVIGVKGGKCLLTIHFVECSLMLAFIRDTNTSKSVTDIFNYLDKILGNELFSKLFPVILTDNGSEFSNPKAIEYRESTPFLRTKVFYCDAGSPYQKGAIEVNHELIRRVLPKGSSFNDFTQDDINLMMNHINSYKRKKLNNRSPYETFSFYHGEEVLHKLGCYPVAAGNIMLKPALLKK